MGLWMLSPLVQSISEGKAHAQPAKDALRGLSCCQPLMLHWKLDLKLKPHSTPPRPSCLATKGR